MYSQMLTFLTEGARSPLEFCPQPHREVIPVQPQPTTSSRSNLVPSNLVPQIQLQRPTSVPRPSGHIPNIVQDPSSSRSMTPDQRSSFSTKRSSAPFPLRPSQAPLKSHFSGRVNPGPPTTSKAPLPFKKTFSGKLGIVQPTTSSAMDSLSPVAREILNQQMTRKRNSLPGNGVNPFSRFSNLSRMTPPIGQMRNRQSTSSTSDQSAPGTPVAPTTVARTPVIVKCPKCQLEFDNARGGYACPRCHHNCFSAFYGIQDQAEVPESPKKATKKSRKKRKRKTIEEEDKKKEEDAKNKEVKKVPKLKIKLTPIMKDKDARRKKAKKLVSTKSTEEMPTSSEVLAPSSDEKRAKSMERKISDQNSLERDSDSDALVIDESRESPRKKKRKSDVAKEKQQFKVVNLVKDRKEESPEVDAGKAASEKIKLHFRTSVMPLISLQAKKFEQKLTPKVNDAEQSIANKHNEVIYDLTEPVSVEPKESVEMIEVSSSETPSAEESSPGSCESQSSDLKDTPTADKDSESQKSENDSESVKPQKSQNDSDMPVNNIEAKSDSISSDSPYFSETKASEVEIEMDSELVEISLRRIRPIFVDIPKKTLDLLPQIIEESMEKLKKVFAEYKEEEDEDVIEIVAEEKPEEPQRSPAQLTEVAPDTRSPDDIGLSDETYSPYSIEDGEHENGADSVKDDYPAAAPLVEVPFNDFALNLSKQLNPNSLVAVSINNNNNVKKTLAEGHKTETSALQESSENKQNDKTETCQDVNKSIPMDQSENKSDSSSQQEKVGSTVDEVVDKSSMNGQAVAPSDKADGSSRRNIFEALEKLAPVFNSKGRDQILVKQEVVAPNDRFLPRVDQRVEQSTSLQKKAPSMSFNIIFKI